MAASPDGVSVQTVKLKVLYTFDADQKDNHLARWPHSLEIQTCFLDNTTQIGVIDLRTCLESITTASPELLTKLDYDYAVYAYDYSEEDTPLVGQGMLSKALNQDENLETESEAMITGKVTKGVMGLFAKNAQPTLEVKLRLKPVAAFTHQRVRSGSVGSMDARQPQWSQSNEGFTLQDPPRSASPMDTTGLENVQRMLSEGGPPRDRNGSFGGDFFNSTTQSRPTSRPGTPNYGPSFNAAPRQSVEMLGRVEQRVAPRQSGHGRRDSINSGYFSGDENMDDGPARKRAKIMKVDWPSKSNFNIERQPDSLRVVASTASSVRLHRPVALSPAAIAQNGNLIEEPVRPPTPIASTKTGKPRGRPRKAQPSNLKHAPLARDSSPATNNHVQSTIAEVSFSSPEDLRGRSVESTPADIPSSPPVMPDHQPPFITSPALPPMLGNHDSGFMSGNLDDLFGEDQMIHFDDFILDKPQDQIKEQDLINDMQSNVEKHYAPVFEEGNEMDIPGSNSTVPTLVSRHLSIQPPPRPLSRAQSFTPAPRISMLSPKLAPAPIPRARQIMEEQKAKGLLPQIPASDPVTRSLHRANTWAPDMSDALMSDALEGAQSKRRSRKKVGKEQTRARLESAIAAGAMPPYCDNCGSIETPAWRRAYTKSFDCSWGDIETSMGQGDCVYKEPLEYHDDGTIKTFKGYKAEKRKGDEADGWVQICLCNPCGLWFHKQKCPRPKEKWQKQDPLEKKKRKRGPKGSMGRKTEGQLNAGSDAVTPASDDSSPGDTATEAPDGDDNDTGGTTGEDETTDSNEPQLPSMPRTVRSNSAEPAPRGLRNHYHHKIAQRNTQSSPVHNHGSDANAADGDLTPKPLRRQLFPSPDKVHIQTDPAPTTASSKIITHLPAFVRRSPRLNKTKDVFSSPETTRGLVALTTDGKENIVPSAIFDDGFDMGYDEQMEETQIPPSTPTPKRRSERLFLKTPQREREFGTHVSPNAQRSPTFRTPVARQRQHPVVAALLGTVKKDITEMTPFTRSIHEALSDAPEYAILTTPKASRSGHHLRNSKKSTPSQKSNIDFPDLPSLKDSSPSNGDGMFAFDFSELSTEPLNTDMHDFSTDAVVPSSPPPNFFSFVNTDEGEDPDMMWSDINFSAEEVSNSIYPSPDKVAPAALMKQSLRRTPRKSHASHQLR